MAAEAHQAAYAAPYYARLNESGADTDTVFRQIRSIAKHTRILVASLRSVGQIEELAGMGFDCFAVPGALAIEWTDNALAIAAVSDFAEAASGR